MNTFELPPGSKAETRWRAGTPTGCARSADQAEVEMRRFAMSYRDGAWLAYLLPKGPMDLEIASARSWIKTMMMAPDENDMGLGDLPTCSARARASVAAMLEDCEGAFPELRKMGKQRRLAASRRSAAALSSLEERWFRVLPRSAIDDPAAMVGRLARAAAFSAARGRRYSYTDPSGAVIALDIDEIASYDCMLPAMLYGASRLAKECGVELRLAVAASRNAVIDAVPALPVMLGAGESLAWARFLRLWFEERAAQCQGKDHVDVTTAVEGFSQGYAAARQQSRGPALLVAL